MGGNYPNRCLEERAFHAKGRARGRSSEASVCPASSGKSKKPAWVNQTSEKGEWQEGMLETITKMSSLIQWMEDDVLTKAVTVEVMRNYRFLDIFVRENQD